MLHLVLYRGASRVGTNSTTEAHVCLWKKCFQCGLLTIAYGPRPIYAQLVYR
jgi:hypothetical protein